MERKDYKLEVIGELLSRKSHARALAKKMSTNHTTILRKLNELYAENAVDYDKEGKNKSYFLKKTSEAKTYAFMAENYKLKKALGKYPILRNVIEKIRENRAIKIAILFGSYAKFSANKESDIDVYVDTLSQKLKQEIEKIDSRINAKIGRYDGKNLLIKEIEKNHIIIKGVENFYERNRFFE
jgi:predicted nucleotidyltransferase